MADLIIGKMPIATGAKQVDDGPLSEDGSGGLILNNPTGTVLETYFTVTVGASNISIGALDDGTGAYLQTTNGALSLYPTTYVEIISILKLSPQTYAAITSITPSEGMIACFTDSNSHTWGANITGTGAFKAIGRYDGSNWTVMG